MPFLISTIFYVKEFKMLNMAILWGWTSVFKFSILGELSLAIEYSGEAKSCLLYVLDKGGGVSSIS